MTYNELDESHLLWPRSFTHPLARAYISVAFYYSSPRPFSRMCGVARFVSQE
jgi:hypothetical protein